MLRLFKSRQSPDLAAVSAGERQDLVRLVERQAEGLFRDHGLNCSETVLLVMNRAFGGGLSDEACLGLGSGFGGGIGNSGCVCGTLSGAVMALGLFLGPAQPGGLTKKDFRRLISGLHDGFRERSGSVCCRDLIADFRHRRSERKHFCQGLTGRVAGEVAGLVITHRPELAAAADRKFLAGNDSGLRGLLDRLTRSGEASAK